MSKGQNELYYQIEYYGKNLSSYDLDYELIRHNLVCMKWAPSLSCKNLFDASHYGNFFQLEI